jgi:hypothetical protein
MTIRNESIVLRYDQPRDPVLDPIPRPRELWQHVTSKDRSLPGRSSHVSPELLVGYLRLLPSATGCYPAFPIARGDIRHLDATMFANSPARDGWRVPLPPAPLPWIIPNAIGMQQVADLAFRGQDGDAG